VRVQAVRLLRRKANCSHRGGPGLRIRDPAGRRLRVLRARAHQGCNRRLKALAKQSLLRNRDHSSALLQPSSFVLWIGVCGLAEDYLLAKWIDVPLEPRVPRSGVPFESPPSPGVLRIMAPRANWKGFLRLSLVTCPVALYPATSESEKISFNQLNRQTGHRIKYLKVDAESGEEVPNEDIVKGYMLDKDQFIEVTKEEIEDVALESTRTIEIDEFVEKLEIDPRYLIRPYYLRPDGKVGQKEMLMPIEEKKPAKKSSARRQRKSA